MVTPPSELNLNEADIQTLVKNADPSARAIAAQRICREIRSTSLTEQDRRRARRVLDYICQDVAAMVRRALAITLKNSPELPHDLAVKLIRDIDNIAVPILECSPVLTDEDLLEVLKSRASAKIMAVANRPTVSGSIVRAIIRFGDSAAVANVAANDRAQLGDAAYREILELASSDDLIQESLIKRRDLPTGVVEKLLSYGSENLAIKLSERHDIPPQVAINLAGRVHERALIDFAGSGWNNRDVAELVSRLYANERLTSSVIVRAAACGNMRFVEHALAIKAGISHPKATLMIYEPGSLGVAHLTAEANISVLDGHILRGAIAIYRDLEVSGIEYDRAYFQRLMIQRILTLPVTFSDEDGDYLLEKLDGLSSLEFE